MTGSRRGQTLSVLFATLFLVSACAQPGPAGPLESTGTSGPAQRTGSAALGTPMSSMNELIGWMRTKTGECKDAKVGAQTDLGAHLGQARARRYEPFIAEWATCAVPEHPRLGLMLLKPDKIKELQQLWQRTLRENAYQESPDLSFGNGFAITSARFGVAKLGLRYLWCKPVEGLHADSFPADAEGCVFTALPGQL